MNFLKELLLKKEVNITQASKDTGLSRYTFNAISKGIHPNIQIGTLKTLSEYFGISVLEFQQRFEENREQLQTKKDQESGVS